MFFFSCHFCRCIVCPWITRSLITTLKPFLINMLEMHERDRRSRDRMVVGFMTTYVISTFHHYSCELQSRSGDTTICNQICQWLAIGRSFSRGNLVSSINTTDFHDITENIVEIVNDQNPNPEMHKPLTLTNMVYEKDTNPCLWYWTMHMIFLSHIIAFMVMYWTFYSHRNNVNMIQNVYLRH